MVRPAARWRRRSASPSYSTGSTPPDFTMSSMTVMLNPLPERALAGEPVLELRIAVESSADECWRISQCQGSCTKRP